MKKLLASFSATSLVVSVALNILSCTKPVMNPYTDGDYFDSELIDVPANIRPYVQYTSSVAKILIASRHENMNTYAFPQLSYFLGDHGQDVNGNFKTKSGKLVNIKKYVDGYKNLNQLDFNPFTYDYTNNIIPKNNYNIMNSIARPDDMSKYYNISANELKNRNTELKSNTWVNPNMGWAQYDTGAYANTLVQRSKNIRDFIDKTGVNYFTSTKEPFASAMIYDNIGLDGVSEDTLSFKDIKSKQKIDYGSAIAKLTAAQYNQFSLQYFNLALQVLGSFQPGLEFQFLAALGLLMPIVPSAEGSNKTFGILLSLPFILAKQTVEDWFIPGTETIKKDSVLGKFFSQQTYDSTVINYKYGNDYKKNQTLKNIINDGYAKAITSIINNSPAYLNVTKDKPNELLKLTAALGDWFSTALEKEKALGNDIDIDEFNQAVNKEISKMLDRAINIMSMAPGIYSSATSLMWIMMQMFKSGKIDTYHLLKGISGFAHWIYQYDNNEDYVPTKHAEEVDKVYTKSDKMQGFSESIIDVDRDSEYGKFVLNTYGFKGGLGYEKGSLFDMANEWSHGSDDVNSDNQAMYIFLQNISNPNSKYSYIYGLLQDIQQSMASEWFDNIFLDKRWYIKATGTGPDGEQLGAVDIDKTNGKVKKIRYQLDYYGPKDASTDLDMHTLPLNYLGTINDRYSNKDTKPSNPALCYSKPPIRDGKEEKWDDYDWQTYDGNGSWYLPNSENIKYSYVVEFTDELSYFDFYVGDKMSFKMTDFKWYYNNQRYY